MKINLLLALCGLSVATAPWNDIPECRVVHDSGYSVPNCPAASTCFKAAHEKAHKCILEELKDKKMRKCQLKPEIRAISKDFFKASCRWHSAVTKCMNGDSIDGWQQQAEARRMRREHHHGHSDHGVNAAHNQSISGHSQGYGLKSGSPCWREVYTKLEACKTTGEHCEHYKVCTGQEEDTESPDDNQAQWYSIVHGLKQTTTEKTRLYRTKVKTCVDEETAAEGSSSSAQDEERTTTTATPSLAAGRRRRTNFADQSSNSAEVDDLERAEVVSAKRRRANDAGSSSEEPLAANRVINERRRRTLTDDNDSGDSEDSQTDRNRRAQDDDNTNDDDNDDDESRRLLRRRKNAKHVDIEHMDDIDHEEADHPTESGFGHRKVGPKKHQKGLNQKRQRQQQHHVTSGMRGHYQES